MSVRFAVLLSGSGTNLQALMDSCSGASHDIALVVSSREDAYGLTRAQRAGIPAFHVPHQGKARGAYDLELVELLNQHQIDWVFLAGFMRILSPVFLDAFPGRVVNIHPSLLPSFPGVNAQQQAFDAGVRVTGATVHFVDAGMDSGAIIAQGSVPVMDSDDVDALRQRILTVEHRVFPMVMRWAAEDRLSMVNGKAMVQLLPGEHRHLYIDV